MTNFIEITGSKIGEEDRKKLISTSFITSVEDSGWTRKIIVSNKRIIFTKEPYESIMQKIAEATA